MCWYVVGIIPTTIGVLSSFMIVTNNHLQGIVCIVCVFEWVCFYCICCYYSLICVDNGLCDLASIYTGSKSVSQWTCTVGGVAGGVCVSPWSGVVCDVNGLVVSVSTSTSVWSGSVPSSVGYLTGLSNLQLSGGNLVGSIPSSIGQLSSLAALYLYSNSL